VNDNPDPVDLQAFLRQYRVERPDSLAIPSPAAQSPTLAQAAGQASPPEPPDVQLGAAGARYRTQPYPGLRSFEDDENDIFFGRKAHVEELLKRLEKQQLIVVLGGSGSGKSSVVRAGLIPELREDRKLPGRLGRWYVADFKPGLRPVDEAYQSLWRQVCEDKVLPTPAGEKALAAALGLETTAADGGTSRAALKSAFDRVLRPGNRIDIDAALWFAGDVLDDLDLQVYGALRAGEPSLMLVVDQFEELFRPDVDRDQRDDLLKLIRAVFDGSKDAASRGFYIVITMRSEELHRCAEFMGLTEIINESMYLIDLIDETALRDAIVKPARRVCESWRLPIGAAESEPFDPKFVSWLLQESSILRASLTHKPDQLPLLQHALKLVWNHATVRWAAQRLKGMPDFSISLADRPEEEGPVGAGFLRNCLNKAADQAYEDAKAAYCGPNPTLDQMADAERLIRAFFVALARRDDRGNWARRLVKHQAVLDALRDLPYVQRERTPTDGVDEDRFMRALAVFIDRGYIVLRNKDASPSGRTYDVCHEALIRSWRRYQLWLDDSGEVARALRQVAEGLMQETKNSVPDRWEYLEPYRRSPVGAWGWLRATKENRASGVVAINNRRQIERVFGNTAIFGAAWACRELINFLKDRARRDGKDVLASDETRYALDAGRLLAAIANAHALLPRPDIVPFLTNRSRPVLRNLGFLMNHVFKAENRMIIFVAFLAYFFSLVWLDQSARNQRLQLENQVTQARSKLEQAEKAVALHDASMLKSMLLMTDQSSRHITQAAFDLNQSVKVIKTPGGTKDSQRIFELATGRIDEAARKFFGAPGVIDGVQLNDEMKKNMKPAQCIALQPAADSRESGPKEYKSLLIETEKGRYRGLGWVKVSDPRSNAKYRWAPVETDNGSKSLFEGEATLDSGIRVGFLDYLRQESPSISCLSRDGSFALLWGKGQTPILIALDWFPVPDPAAPHSNNGGSGGSWKVSQKLLPSILAPSQNTALNFVQPAAWQDAADGVGNEHSAIQEITIGTITLFLLSGSDKGGSKVGIQLVRGAQLPHRTGASSTDVDKLLDVENCTYESDIRCTVSTMYGGKLVNILIFRTHYNTTLDTATSSSCKRGERLCYYDIYVMTPEQVRLATLNHISARLKRVGFASDDELLLLDDADQVWRFGFGASGPAQWAERTLSYRAEPLKPNETSRACQDMRCYEWK
jgi:hypothetical protein